MRGGARSLSLRRRLPSLADGWRTYSHASERFRKRLSGSRKSMRSNFALPVCIHGIEMCDPRFGNNCRSCGTMDYSSSAAEAFIASLSSRPSLSKPPESVYSWWPPRIFEAPTRGTDSIAGSHGCQPRRNRISSIRFRDHSFRTPSDPIRPEHPSRPRCGVLVYLIRSPRVSYFRFDQMDRFSCRAFHL